MVISLYSESINVLNSDVSGIAHDNTIVLLYCECHKQ